MTNAVVIIKNTEIYSIYESTVQLILDDKPNVQYKVLDKRNGNWSHPLNTIETYSIKDMLSTLSLIDKELYEIIMQDMDVQIV
ncbi:hypothetical protein GA-1p44 [Bacillus phage GA1]|uniref:Uncharacterized protein n=1 Tax=Bacillus phage GA-1 TaxID=2679898 RepID=Q9FZV4_BPGA1|nr:hypothetical protein GA-1p44 [Bacillus phage GA1]CAC21542.1 hypothetical protein [Bacillus phage GA1]